MNLGTDVRIRSSSLGPVITITIDSTGLRADLTMKLKMRTAWFASLKAYRNGASQCGCKIQGTHSSNWCSFRRQHGLKMGLNQELSQKVVTCAQFALFPGFQVQGMLEVRVADLVGDYPFLDCSPSLLPPSGFEQTVCDFRVTTTMADYDSIINNLTSSGYMWTQNNEAVSRNSVDK